MVGQNDLRIVLIDRLVHPTELFERTADLEGDGEPGGWRQPIVGGQRAVGGQRLGVARAVVGAHGEKRVCLENLRPEPVVARGRLRDHGLLKHEDGLVKTRLFNQRLCLNYERRRDCGRALVRLGELGRSLYRKSEVVRRKRGPRRPEKRVWRGGRVWLEADIGRKQREGLLPFATVVCEFRKPQHGVRSNGRVRTRRCERPRLLQRIFVESKAVKAEDIAERHARTALRIRRSDLGKRLASLAETVLLVEIASLGLQFAKTHYAPQPGRRLC